MLRILSFIVLLATLLQSCKPRDEEVSSKRASIKSTPNYQIRVTQPKNTESRSNTEAISEEKKLHSLVIEDHGFELAGDTNTEVKGQTLQIDISSADEVDTLTLVSKLQSIKNTFTDEYLEAGKSIGFELVVPSTDLRLLNESGEFLQTAGCMMFALLGGENRIGLFVTRHQEPINELIPKWVGNHTLFGTGGLCLDNNHRVSHIGFAGVYSIIEFAQNALTAFLDEFAVQQAQEGFHLGKYINFGTKGRYTDTRGYSKIQRIRENRLILVGKERQLSSGLPQVVHSGHQVSILRGRVEDISPTQFTALRNSFEKNPTVISYMRQMDDDTRKVFLDRLAYTGYFGSSTNRASAFNLKGFQFQGKDKQPYSVDITFVKTF